MVVGTGDTQEAVATIGFILRRPVAKVAITFMDVAVALQKQALPSARAAIFHIHHSKKAS